LAGGRKAASLHLIDPKSVAIAVAEELPAQIASLACRLL